MLLGNPSFREFSRTVAASDLLADFCGVRRIDGITGISKSTLERASKFFDQEQVRWMNQVVVEMCGEADRAKELGLAEPMQTDVCLVDTTCLEASIHFPVDWVLLRDVALTLLKAIKLIRNSGLLHRMPEEPEAFARQMNRLCIEMTHARRHRDCLAANFAQTHYSARQAQRIMDRIDGMLAQVPAVIEQAHERLIGGRQVPSEKKILSVYEQEVQVIVRGKAGREVEFGNTLYVAESPQGLILDFEFYPQRAPAEWRQMEASLTRQNRFDLDEPLTAVCADRGFSARKGSKALGRGHIYDAICPRDPSQLQRRMKEPRFAALQRRRASTEARIATLKHKQGRRLRAKGFGHRYVAVAWSVLGHNLWIVARRRIDEKAEPLAA